MLFDDQERQSIVQAARRRLERCLSNEHPDKGCLYAATALIIELTHRDVRVIAQAGTMCWPRIHMAQDDGYSPTHWSYVWSPAEAASIAAVLGGNLPEMHIWAAIPETKELIDINTRHFPKACKETLDLDWPGPAPPDYLWIDSEDGLPEHTIYQPSERATRLAVGYMTENAIPLLMKGNPRESSS